MHVAEQVGGVVGHEVGGMRLDRDFRVKAADFAGGSDGLGKRFSGVGLVEEHLALKIAGLNVVAIDDAQVADSGAREQGRQR